MQSPLELEDGEIESDSEDIGKPQTNPSPNDTLQVDKIAGIWQCLSDTSNDNQLNNLSAVTEIQDESFDVLLRQYYKLRGELNTLQKKENRLNSSGAKDARQLTESHIATRKAELAQRRDVDELDEIQLRLDALESTLSKSKESDKSGLRQMNGESTSKQSVDKRRSSGVRSRRPTFGSGKDVDMRMQRPSNSHHDIDMRSWMRPAYVRPASRNGKSRRRRPLLETPTPHKAVGSRLQSNRKSRSNGSSKESSRTASTATPNSVAEVGTSDRLAEVLRLKNSILMNDDPTAQFWEFLKMVKGPTPGSVDSFGKRDNLDPVSMDVVMEADDSVFNPATPTSSYPPHFAQSQPFGMNFYTGHHNGEMFCQPTPLFPHFSGAPTDVLRYPQRPQGDFGWNLMQLQQTQQPSPSDPFYYRTVSPCQPPLPPPVPTPPPPPPPVQPPPLSPAKFSGVATNNSSPSRPDKEVADVIKKIFECSQLSEDEAAEPPILQLRNAVTPQTQRQRRSSAVKKRKTVESESDNDEEVEALRALVIGTMSKKENKRQKRDQLKRSKKDLESSESPQEVEMGQVAKESHRSPSSDRSVGLLDEGVSPTPNSIGSSADSASIVLVEMDRCDSQSGQEDTRKVELEEVDVGEIVLRSPDPSSGHRIVETTQNSSAQGWSYADRTVLMNQKKFEPATSLTVVAGPSGTRVIDRRKPKKSVAPVPRFKAPPQHKPLIIPVAVSDDSDEEEVGDAVGTHSNASAMVSAYLQQARSSVELKEKQEAARKEKRMTDVLSLIEDRLESCGKELNGHRLIVQEDRKRLQSLASIKASRKDDLNKAEMSVQLLRDQLRKAELMCAMKKESFVVVTEEIRVVQNRLGENSNRLDMLEAQYKDTQQIFMKHRSEGNNMIKPASKPNPNHQLEQRRLELKRLEQECIRKLKEISPTKSVMVSPVKSVIKPQLLKESAKLPVVNLPHKWTRNVALKLSTPRVTKRGSYRLRKSRFDRINVLKQRLSMAQRNSVDPSETSHPSLRFTNTHPLACFRSYRLSPNFRSATGAERLSLTFTNKLDLFTPLCPFDLSGECKDINCIWQHRRNFTPSMEEGLRDLLGYVGKESVRFRTGLRFLIRCGKRTGASTKNPRLIECLNRIIKNDVDVFECSLAHTSGHHSTLTDCEAKKTSSPGHSDKEKEEKLRPQRYFHLPVELVKEPNCPEDWMEKAEEQLKDVAKTEVERITGAIGCLCKGLEEHRSSNDLWLKYFELLEKKGTPVETLVKLLRQAVGLCSSEDLRRKLASMENCCALGVVESFQLPYAQPAVLNGK